MLASGMTYWFLARGRGIARLIQGCIEGDPVSIGITTVLVVIIGVSIYVKTQSGD